MSIILFCGLFFVKWSFVQLFFPEPAVIQTFPSPDGKYIAYLFEKSGGATTGFVYHISLIRSDKKLGKGNGNIYISNIPPKSIEWLDNHTLYIDDYKSNRTTRSRDEFKEVVVKYASKN